MLYSQLQNPLDEEEILEIVQGAVAIEQAFIRSALPGPLIGINAHLMNQYIEFVADRLLNSLHCQRFYHSPNPFDFMELISLQGKTNFFEKRVSEYQKTGVMNYSQNNTLQFTEDF